MKINFKTSQAARLGGYRSTHMIDYLHRSKSLVGSARTNPGRGRSRLYRYGDIVLLRAINDLLRRRIPVKGMHRDLKKAQQALRLATPGSVSESYLITNGDHAEIVASREDMLETWANWGERSAVVMSLATVEEEVLASMNVVERKALDLD